MSAAEIITETLDLFRKLKKAASAQRALAREGRLDGFLEQCTRREDLQQRISANQQRYRQLRKGTGGGHAGARTQALRLEMTGIIEAVQTVDRETEALLEGERQDVLESLQGLRRGIKALRGYGQGPAPRGPRFIDRQG